MFSDEDLLAYHELILSKTSNHRETLSYLLAVAEQLEKPGVVKSLDKHAEAISDQQIISGLRNSSNLSLRLLIMPYLSYTRVSVDHAYGLFPLFLTQPIPLPDPDDRGSPRGRLPLPYLPHH